MSIEKHSKKSANVSETEYDTETKKLTVVFKSFKDGSLSKYIYSGVPADLWAALKEADSLGGFVNKHVAKAGYSFEKIY